MGKSTQRPSRASAITREVMSEVFQQRKRASEVGKAGVNSKSTGARQDVVFVIAMLACLVLTGLNVTGTMPFQTVVEAKSGAEVERMAYQTVNFAVREIDAYRRQYGYLPETLTDVGAPTDPRWDYQVLSEDRYLIRFEAPGFPLAYDSRGDADEFFSTVRRY
jgi:hypothetical protein